MKRNFIFGFICSVLVTGYTAKRGDENNMGHMWLCHGLMEGIIKLKRYVNGELYGTATKSEWYVLCNWGKDGKYDGYYLSGVFDTGSSGSGSGGAYYQYDLTAITGIRL